MKCVVAFIGVAASLLILLRKTGKKRDRKTMWFMKVYEWMRVDSEGQHLLRYLQVSDYSTHNIFHHQKVSLSRGENPQYAPSH